MVRDPRRRGARRARGGRAGRAAGGARHGRRRRGASSTGSSARVSSGSASRSGSRRSRTSPTRAPRSATSATAELLYPELEPLRRANVMIGHGVACYGAADRYLGMLAATLGDSERADEHFERRSSWTARWGRATWLAPHGCYEYGRTAAATAARRLAPGRLPVRGAWPWPGPSACRRCSAGSTALGGTAPEHAPPARRRCRRARGDPAASSHGASATARSATRSHQRAHRRQPRPQHPAQDRLREPHRGGRPTPTGTAWRRAERATIGHMPLYVIERNFAEQLDLTSDDVQADRGGQRRRGRALAVLVPERRSAADRTASTRRRRRTRSCAAAQRADVPADVVVEVTRVSADMFV